MTTRRIENWLPTNQIDMAAIRQGGILAQAIARMHDCEAGWWYALHTNRRRPRKVMQALELIYA